MEEYTLMHGKPLSPLGFLSGFVIDIVKNTSIQKGKATLMVNPDDLINIKQ